MLSLSKIAEEEAVAAYRQAAATHQAAQLPDSAANCYKLGAALYSKQQPPNPRAIPMYEEAAELLMEVSTLVIR